MGKKSRSSYLDSAAVEVIVIAGVFLDENENRLDPSLFLKIVFALLSRLFFFFSSGAPVAGVGVLIVIFDSRKERN